MMVTAGIEWSPEDTGDTSGALLPVVYFALAIFLLQPYYLLLPVGLGIGLSAYPIVTITLACAGLALTGWNARLLLPILWAVSAVFQNLFIGLYLNAAPEAFDRLLLPMFEIKSTVLATGMFAILFLGAASRRAFQFSAIDVIYSAFVTVVLFSFFASPAPTVSKLSYLRNFTAYILLYYVGLVACRDRQDARVFAKVLLIVGAVLSVVSVLDLVWPHFWSRELNVGRIEAAKGPISHFTDFLGFHVRRLKSAVGEPVNGGYIFACLTLVALTTGRKLWAGVLGTQLLLTFAKGPMLICGVGALLWHYTKRKRSRGEMVSASVLLRIAGAAVFAMLCYATVISLRVPLARTTTWAHFLGLRVGIWNAFHSPFGRGIGTGGNYLDVAGLIGAADRPSEQQWLGSGAESAVGVVGTQLGWVGLFLFGVSLILLLRESWRALVQTAGGNGPDHALAITACGGVLGICVTAFLQEGALSPQAAGLFYLIAGMAVSLGRASARHVRRHGPVLSAGQPPTG